MNPTIAESLPILCLVVVGFVLKKIGVIQSEDRTVLTRIILKLTLPAVIFLSISQANVEPITLGFFAVCSAIVSIILRILSGSIVKWLRIDPSIGGVIILSTMIMNIGIFFFPLIQTLYGSEGVSRLAAFDIGNSLMASGYGYYLATCFGSCIPCGFRGSFKKVVTLPILWAAVLGLVVNLTSFNLPPFLVKILTQVSAANTPLAMITLGVYVNFKFPNWKLMSLTVFLRMGVGYLIGLLIVFLTGLQGLDRLIISVGSSVPIGMVPLVYAASEGLDTEFAAACISSSIIVGVIFTPLLLSI